MKKEFGKEEKKKFQGKIAYFKDYGSEALVKITSINVSDWCHK